jgi:hypothetical protein
MTSASQSSSNADGLARQPLGPTKPTPAYEAYGPRADAADRQEIVAVVKRYYAAAAAQDGAKACSLLYSGIAKSVPEDYGESPGTPYMDGKTCAAVLSKLFEHRNGQPTADLAAMEVADVRVNIYNEALVLLRLPTKTYDEVSLHREGKSWKILQLLGGPLR